MENNNIVFFIHEETVQDFAESNKGRRLTPAEINRMAIAVFNSTRIHCLAMDIMDEAADEAMDNSNGQWDAVDDDFRAGDSMIHKLAV